MARDQTKPAGYYCHGTSKQHGNPCAKRAGFGTDHVGYGLCKFHGGATKAGRAAAFELMASEGAATFGLPVETTAGDALQQELERTVGYVGWLATVIAGSPETADIIPAYQARLMKERRHLTVVAAKCMETRLDERRVELMERDAVQLADRFRRFAIALGVDPASDECRAAFRSVLTQGDVIELQA